MKKMKKLLSMLLAVVMVLVMASPSFAAEEKGSITINNPIKDQKYSIYKIFDLESYAEGNYSYKVVEAWRSFIEGYSTLFTINAAGYLTENKLLDSDDSFDREQFAKDALTFATTNNISVAAGPITADGTNAVVFNNIDLGYYLVDSSAGALCALNTADPNKAVNEKNQAPTIEKERTYEPNEDSNDNTVTVGDIVNYTITVTAKAGAQDYIVHDAMIGLSFNGLTEITKNGTPLAADEYTLTTTGLEDECAFEIEFTDKFYGALKADDVIIVKYSATVTADAITENKATNTATLEYGSNGITGSTPKDVVESPTYRFGLMKTRTDGTLLEGATFTLYEKVGENNYTAIPVVYDGTNGYYRKAVNGEAGVNIVAGKVVIAGLGNGIYGLKEESAPTGFNKLEGYTDVEIKDDHKLVNTADGAPYADGDGGVQIINNVGTLLPSTGGIGTTIFYAAGIILMAGAVFFVVRRKKA